MFRRNKTRVVNTKYIISLIKDLKGMWSVVVKAIDYSNGYDEVVKAKTYSYKEANVIYRIEVMKAKNKNNIDNHSKLVFNDIETDENLESRDGYSQVIGDFPMEQPIRVEIDDEELKKAYEELEEAKRKAEELGYDGKM